MLSENHEGMEDSGSSNLNDNGGNLDSGTVIAGINELAKEKTVTQIKSKRFKKKCNMSKDKGVVIANREYKHEFEPDLLALFEAIISGSKVDSVVSKMGFDNSFRVETIMFSGEIPHRSTRELLGEDLGVIVADIEPWFMAGDFNAILRCREMQEYFTSLYTMDAYSVNDFPVKGRFPKLEDDLISSLNVEINMKEANWDIVGKNAYTMVYKVFMEGSLDPKLNRTLLVLIPKSIGTNTIK
ncbi:hypothetical protein Gogos_017691 [Gossypium gossypioides]|uniref:Uncharacterized protein n=1 Tax=Gossypium gossypioides TaxID=34282 RepID=A0A7J9BBQ6_GOSGO|nr:hypothetical protein [Gossypium gossypioides]